MIIIQILKSVPRLLVWMFVFVIGMVIYWGDRIAWKVLRYDKKSQFARRGSCQKTGVCCRSICIEFPKSWIRRPWIVRLICLFYETIYNFYFIQVQRENLVFFECHYLTSQNTCEIRPFRPKICREYPAVFLWGHAKVHRGCGYWFIERSKIGSFSEKMAREEHRRKK